MKFETNEDLAREHVTIGAFCKKYGTEFTKLPDWDIDYIVHRKGKAECFAEVKTYTTTHGAYPSAMLSMIKLGKLNSCSKYLPTVLIMKWSCGTIGWIRIEKIHGVIKWGGRPPRNGSTNDKEFIIYYPLDSINILS